MATQTAPAVAPAVPVAPTVPVAPAPAPTPAGPNSKAKVDPRDPAVRRLVYNMYRGMLGGYNGQANDIVDALPSYRVREDQGIAQHLHNMIQQSREMSGQSSPGIGCGGPPPAPGFPPPPPPPGPGGVIPSMRIQTEIPDSRGRSGHATVPGEPPAAIQNAMMTKDKKPFTYTPGGIDLSQIRSPRIQRRIERNAQDQGAAQTAPPPPSSAPGSLPPAALAAMQPHMHVQVLPPVGGAPPPPPPPPPQGAPVDRNNVAHHPPPPPPPGPAGHLAPHQIAQATVSAEAVSKAAASLRPTGILRREPQPQQPPSPPVVQHQPQYQSAPPQPQYQSAPLQPQYQAAPPQPHPVQVQPDVTTNGRWRPQSEAGSLYVPPVATSQQRTSPTAQLGSLYIPPVSNQPAEVSPTTPPPPPQRHYAPGSPQVQLQKAPTPWLSQMHQRQAQQQLQQQQQQQQQAPQSHSQPQARIIPIQIEGQESPKSRSPQSPPQWQQSSQPSWQQQQAQPSWSPQTPQWQAQQSQPQWHTQPQSPAPQSSNKSERVIPIQIEGSSNGSPHPWRQQAHQPQTPQTPQSQYPQNDGSGPSQWGVGAPVQSRSFRVLQKLTDMDQPDAGDGEPVEQGASYSRGPFPGNQRGQADDTSAQLRKLQLSEDDRALMNKFKAQVDDETYLHSEADPRYRGAAIPSRAFRMLQNMTGAYPDQAVPSGRPVNRLANRPGPVQQPAQEAAPQPYIPPSEQTAPEPRKYTGGAIPSRSFRMLQAMTAGSENCANGRQTPMSVQQQGNGAGRDSYVPASVSPPRSAQSPQIPYHSPDGQWGYYPPPQSAQQQQHMWDHYNAMCAYVATYGYPPPPYPSGYPHYLYDPYSHWSHLYPSDSEELSGYSSTDEMAYYGANFARKAGRATPNMLHPKDAWKRPPIIRNTPKITVTSTPPDPPQPLEPKSSRDSSVDTKDSEADVQTDSLTDSQTRTSDKKESSSGSDSESDSNDSNSHSESSETDTEVEESDYPTSDSRGLRSIRSVPNISTYSGSDAMDSPTTESDNQSEDSYDGEDDVVIPPDQDIPHQLSVIMEESELSDVESIRRARRETLASEEDESSAAVMDTESDSDLDPEDDSTVMVSLPLKLKFSRSENDEEVTTVIVGDVRRTSLTDSDSPGTPQGSKSRPFDFRKSDADDSDVSVTFTLHSRSRSMASPASDGTEDETTNNALSAFSLSTHSSNDGDQIIPSSTRRNSVEVKANPSDISVYLPFRPRKNRTPLSAESGSAGSEEEDSKAKSTEESDYHWEDDSSSTSVQTVRGLTEKTVTESEKTDLQRALPSETRADEAQVDKDDDEEDDEDEENEEGREEEEFGWGEDGTIVKIGSEKSTSEDVSAALNGTATYNSDNESCSDSSSNSSRAGSEVCSEGRSHASKEFGLDQDDSGNRVEFVNDVAVNSQLEDIEDNSDEFDDSEVDAEGKPEEVEEIVRNIIATMKNTNKRLEHPDDGLRAAIDRTACPEQNLDVRVTAEKNSNSKGESEEEDSGVTSDMSRHISEAENDDSLDTNKKRKLSRYQRASTHSRLFKLLQEESMTMNGQNEAIESPPTADLFHEENINSIKERLTLPLLNNVISDPDSLSSSSGITSPASPTVTDRVVTDLVQTLLQRKKGKKFRKLPMAKLHAAALRILQEDMDPYDTVSSTSEEGYNRLHMSPVNPTVGSESPGDAAQSSPYGSNYNEYCNYYNSWNGAQVEYDIMPSRAFKLLDQHAMPGGFSPGVIEGLMAKCPRVRSSKHINRDFSVTSQGEADSQTQDISQSCNAGTGALVREDH